MSAEIDSLQETLDNIWSLQTNNFVELTRLLDLDPRKDFIGADLRGADLRNANLQEFNFRGADLRGADLRGAQIRAESFRGAILEGAFADPAALERIENFKKKADAPPTIDDLIELATDTKRSPSSRKSAVRRIEGSMGATSEKFNALLLSLSVQTSDEVLAVSIDALSGFVSEKNIHKCISNYYTRMSKPKGKKSAAALSSLVITAYDWPETSVGYDLLRRYSESDDILEFCQSLYRNRSVISHLREPNGPPGGYFELSNNKLIEIINLCQQMPKNNKFSENLMILTQQVAYPRESIRRQADSGAELFALLSRPQRTPAASLKKVRRTKRSDRSPVAQPNVWPAIAPIDQIQAWADSVAPTRAPQVSAIWGSFGNLKPGKLIKSREKHPIFAAFTGDREVTDQELAGLTLEGLKKLHLAKDAVEWALNRAPEQQLKQFISRILGFPQLSQYLSSGITSSRIENLDRSNDWLSVLLKNDPLSKFVRGPHAEEVGRLRIVLRNILLSGD